MLAVLNVGEAEKHVVEVELSYWSGLRTVRVDGKEVDRQRSFRPWSRLSFFVGDKEEHRIELRFNSLLMSSRAYVDGMLFRRSLFPQVQVYNLFPLVGLLAAAAIIGVLMFRPLVEMHRGYAAYQRKDYGEAVAHYDEAIRLGKEDATVYHNRGVARLEIKQYDEALADFTRAIQLDPNAIESYLERGKLYFDRKDYVRAGSDFAEALRLDPSQHEARTYLQEAERLHRPK